MKHIPYPSIVRAREYKLYSTNGKQYIDLYLVGGKALLGHRVPHCLHAVKSTLARGLWAPYPSIYQGRVEKLLNSLFPQFPHVQLAKSDIQLHQLLAESCGVPGATVLPGAIADMAYDMPPYKKILRWRPHACNAPMAQQKKDSAVPASKAVPVGSDQPVSVTLPDSVEVVLPVLPVVSDVFPRVVLSRNPLEFHAKSLAGEPMGLHTKNSHISPFVLDTMVKALAALQGSLKNGYYNTKNPSKLEQVIDTKGWQRIGPYVRVPLTGKGYYDFAMQALEAGFFVAPTPQDPLIIPATLTLGEETRLLQFLRGV